MSEMRSITENAPQMIAEAIRWGRRTRFNPLKSFDGMSLGRSLENFERGELREAAMFWDAIARRDDTIPSVKAKREKSVAHKPLETVTLEKSPDADAHREVLEAFWKNVRYVNAWERNDRGGVQKLIRSMQTAVSNQYAAHHIIWQPTPQGLRATFEYVPVWFFEARDALLRFLPLGYGLEGQDLEEQNWMIGFGDGLMFASSIGYYLKRSSLQDWLRFSEKFAMPGVFGKTSAEKDSEEGRAMRDAVTSFGQEWAAVLYGHDGSKTSGIELIQANGNPSAMPMPALIERVDKKIAALYRGADLSSMSSGSNTEGTGASLQGEEQDILERADAADRSEELRGVERTVIAWHFGAGTEPLAQTRLIVPEREDQKLLLEATKTFVDMGARIGIQGTMNRFGLSEADEDESAFVKSEKSEVGGQKSESPVIDVPGEVLPNAFNPLQPRHPAGDPNGGRWVAIAEATRRSAEIGDFDQFRSVFRYRFDQSNKEREAQLQKLADRAAAGDPQAFGEAEVAAVEYAVKAKRRLEGDRVKNDLNLPRYLSEAIREGIARGEHLTAEPSEDVLRLIFATRPSPAANATMTAPEIPLDQLSDLLLASAIEGFQEAMGEDDSETAANTATTDAIWKDRETSGGDRLPSVLTSANAAAVEADADGWYQIAPYGEYLTVDKKWIQVFGPEQARAMVRHFNSVPFRLTRWLFSNEIPVFIGHPDVDRKTWSDERKLAVRHTALEAREDGLWGKAEWNEEGRSNLANGYWQYPSPVWLYPNPESLLKRAGQKLFGRERTNRVYPDVLQSVGLTNFQNIPDARRVTHNADPGTTQNEDDMNPELLAALGLDESATIEQVLEKIAAMKQAADAANGYQEKATKMEGDLSTANAALETARTDLQTLRTVTANAMLDTAIAGGSITAGERKGWEQRFLTDYEGAANALAEIKPGATGLNTKSVDLPNKPQTAPQTAAGRIAAFNAAVKEHAEKHPKLSYDACVAAVRSDPAMAHIVEAMNPTTDEAE